MSSYPWAPESSYASSSKPQDHDFDFDYLLNLPPFSPPSSAESPLLSSPENETQSLPSRPSPEDEFASVDSASSFGALSPLQPALSWEGILKGPVWPDVADESSSSGGHLSPFPSLSTASPASLLTPSSTTAPSMVPDFSFATTSTSSAAAAAPVQPSSALLEALQAYNSRYGTILPTTSASSSATPPNAVAGSSTSVASAHGDSEHDDDEHAHDEHGSGGDEDEDAVAYRDLFGSSYNATAGPSSSAYSYGDSLGPRRTTGGQIMSSVVVEEGEERMEGDEWRPTPEEYKALNSKQKRQLRNKISARNFRNRRKNQISTLESRLNDRERLIGAVRDELGSARMENAELRKEIQALKNAVFGATQTPAFQSNTISPAQLAAVSASPSSTSSSSSAPLNQVNRTKDAGFWAGQHSSPFGAGPFDAQVHSFTTPDLIFPPSAAMAGKPQPNLNPLFNIGGPTGSLFSPPNFKPSLPTATSQEGTFDEFVQSTPYTLRHATVEAYRNQLWTRLAREAAYSKAATSTNGADALASGLRPKFYTSPTSTSSFLPGSKLLGSSTSHTAPSMSTPASSSPSPAAASSAPEDTSHLAFLATIATQSITSRLSAAFVEAFSTPAPTFASLGPFRPSTASRSLDADKIASVLSGRAKVQIVPIAPAAPAPPTQETESALERALAGLSLGGGASATGGCASVSGLKSLLGCAKGRACHTGRPSSE